MNSLQERAWGYVNVTFPVRQIYIRSDGRVQFFTFSPLMQAACAGASLLLLGWVAFTSVNVIFKDRIIAAKERHFELMQASYENRIADLQLSYDELNGALVTAEDRFKAVADALDAKQQTIAQLIEHKESVRASLGSGKAPVKSAANLNVPTVNPALGAAGGIGGAALDAAPNSLAAYAPSYAPGLRPAGAVSTAPRETASQPAAALPERQAFLAGAVKRFGALFSRAAVAKNVDNPSLRQIESDKTRVLKLDATEASLLLQANKELSAENTRLSKVLNGTGVNVKSLMSRVGDGRAMGGPLIPIGPSNFATGDIGFNNGVTDAMNSLTQLSDTVTVLKAMPLATPLSGGSITSGFGGRVDPFSENLAYHTGIDFSAPIGTDVFVTAPGVVVFAGKNGAYGNSIEVDHGYGMRTRYGHLSKILAEVGQKVQKGDVIGKLGSTGRSTGPHVHYEVWYDDAVRDPGRFIKAGQNVFQE